MTRTAPSPQSCPSPPGAGAAPPAVEAGQASRPEGAAGPSAPSGPQAAAATSFADLGLELWPEATAALARDGIVAPTAAQVGGIPAILRGGHQLVQASTGSGKTLAYLLPLLQQLRGAPEGRLLVLAPSPELALQILSVARAYGGVAIGCLGLVGCGSLERQKERLKRHPQVMVGTAGRIIELIVGRKIKAAKLTHLVLDEIDAILSPQHLVQLSQICRRPEVGAQIICASATVGPRAREFITTCLASGAGASSVPIVAAAQAPLQANITHQVLQVGDSAADREAALMAFLRRDSGGRGIIFVNKLWEVTHLHHLLERAGMVTASLSGERNKLERERAMTALKAGACRVIIATDTAARGLDIPQLSWVVHFQAAIDADTYLHRAGRVGRAGRSGCSLVLAARRDTYTLKRHASTLKIAFTAAAAHRDTALA